MNHDVYLSVQLKLDKLPPLSATVLGSTVHFICGVFLYIQITLVSDYINDTFVKEKEFEKELVDEGTYVG